MGDHVARGEDTSVNQPEEREDARDPQIAAIDKRDERQTIQGMPPLERAPASKPGS